MTIAAELARRINTIGYDELPPDAVAWAKDGVRAHHVGTGSPLSSAA